MSNIDVKEIFFRYADQWVIEDLSFQVGGGEFWGIIGPNGSGKTTLLKVLYGLFTPQRGEVFIDGGELRRMKRSDIARKIAVVPQEHQINFPFTSIEVVLMGRSPYLGRLQFERRDDFEIAERAMELTNTLHFSRRPINELSGGERQRIIIARALAQEPEIILFDEPTANLDISHQVEFYELITRLNREKKLTILTVSHDINLASEYCRKILLLKGGRIFKMGSPREVVAEEYISHVYESRVLVDENPITGAPRITLLPRDTSNVGMPETEGK
ncbi:MAG: ABC transporter ATP-binding protein [Syntrophobacterales bacterium]|nr:MAG: ABC transporter ATP-binding protein [Syntrophobacterales bacterium]